jgi:nucleoside-diphosphate-sugar epimerase
VRRVVVIGATGHVGTYLVPRLVRAGWEVIALSRGEREPYQPAPEWRAVQRVTADRDAPDLPERVAAFEADAVIDMICFTAGSAAALLDALRLHPGHISGPGWPVITPAGNLDPDVWRRLAVGEPLALPDLGLGVLHHVHADDVAQAFERALTRPAAIGSSFHVVSEQAMTLRGLATGVAAWFGREPVLDFVDWPEFERRVGAGHATATREHVGRSIAASIDRARAVLGYAPRYSSLQALHEAVRWLAANGAIDVGGQDF